MKIHPVRIRKGMTLLELLLSLALTVVVAGIVGALVQSHLVNQNTGRDRVEQAKLARSILNMIADDIRSVVRHQSFDASGLSQILGGGSSTTSTASTGSTTSSTGSTSSTSSTSSSLTSASSMSMGSSGVMTAANLPPGIYGSANSIEIDISRLPRPDEYYPQAADLSLGTVGDMPSDVKTVGYYVQAIREDGVKDPLGGMERIVNGTIVPEHGAGGLIRRSVDRAITQYAYEQAITDSLMRTGEIVAPEVVSIDFQYFDGTMWQIQWDSSTLGLPRVIKVSIALQRESKFITNPMEPGVSMTSLTRDTMGEYGIDIYSVNVIIPGVQLLTNPTTSTSGTSSLGY